MSDSAPLDQRARHELREQAIWRTKVAGYAAFASAASAGDGPTPLPQVEP